MSIFRKQHRILNIAHRGFSGNYPENTLLAFQKAIETGCDGIELDIHLTKDHQIVIIHDESIDRTTDGVGEVRDFTLKELRKFDAHGKFSGRFPVQRIPTLREYFDLVKDLPILTNIEIKNNDFYYEGLEEAAIALIKEYKLSDRILFSSFNNTSILKCKQLAPEIKTGFLCDAVIGNPGVYTASFGVDYLHPNFKRMKEEDYRDCTAHRVGVNVWTVNSQTALEEALKLPVHAIITNYPDRLQKLLNR